MEKLFLGKAIIQLREDRKMSQTDLAEACGIRQPTLSLYESGKRMPSEKNLQRIAVALGCVPNEIRSISIKLRSESEQSVKRDEPRYPSLYSRRFSENFSTYLTDDISVSFRTMVRDEKDGRGRPLRYNAITDIVERVLQDYIEVNRDEIEELIAEEIEVSIGDVTKFLDDLKRNR